MLAIAEGLSKLGIAISQEQASDMEIHAEFLNAGWSIGKKKLTYDAYILVSGPDKTVFMWEMSKEIGGGFSFGGGVESFSRSGGTVFRKVKSVQYGPQGKAYEMTLDLGAIPRIVKEAAKRNGWKFQTVMKAEKARYPQK